MEEILVCKADGTITTKEKFYKEFQRNLQYPNGWARTFKSFEACVKAWFW